METDIYKSTLIPSAYLFVRAGNRTDELPSQILDQLGELNYFKSITLIPDSPLIAADPNIVIENIENNGYHIQGATITIKESDVSEVGAAVGGGILAVSLGLGPFGAIAGAAIGLWLANQSKAEEKE